MFTFCLFDWYWEKTIGLCTGGSPLTAEEFKQCILKAKERTKQLIQLIDTTIMSPER